MRPPKRFDEYYRCYPTIMLPGPERPHLNFGGKVIMPPSALEKLTRLHITYPMLFELINGQVSKSTHAGVLEFVAEEGKIHLPFWMMQTLLIETGDLIQVRSTDLEPARLVKLQPQSVSFLDISDPKAVLEKAFRDFSTLTQNDIFSFEYNDTVYDIAVLEVKPQSENMGVSMLETDVEVDFAAPVGYVDPRTKQDNSTNPPGNEPALPSGSHLQGHGTMARSINYDAIAPSAAITNAGSSNFLSGGHSLKTRGKKGKVTTSQRTASVAVDQHVPSTLVVKSSKRSSGPQPLRLSQNKLFFGFERKPYRTQDQIDQESAHRKDTQFLGHGQVLRDGKLKKEEMKNEIPADQSPDRATGRRLDGRKV